jgi:hypothetical protein
MWMSMNMNHVRPGIVIERTEACRVINVAEMDYEPLRVEDLLSVDFGPKQFECLAGARDLAIVRQWSITKLFGGLLELKVQHFAPCEEDTLYNPQMPFDVAIVWAEQSTDAPGETDVKGIVLAQHVLDKWNLDVASSILSVKAQYSFIAELDGASYKKVYAA